MKQERIHFHTAARKEHYIKLHPPEDPKILVDRIDQLEKDVEFFDSYVGDLTRRIMYLEHAFNNRDEVK